MRRHAGQLLGAHAARAESLQGREVERIPRHASCAGLFSMTR
jgi:hypothetical protein